MVEPVRRSITVQAPQARAFSVFTEGLGEWWPLSRYAVGGQPAVTAVLEPHEGGRWFERAADGTECGWGHVIAWQPPERVVLSWEIDADWRANPDTASEVEVRFIAEGEGSTRVELEHRNLEVYAGRAEELRQSFDSEHGWNTLLGEFGRVAAGVGATPALAARG
ncbi:MAG TPA: SRPBCC family protein [Capillimicrobium sp.]|jgi:uncharacterized protein YndB with AHSA1/START domain